MNADCQAVLQQFSQIQNPTRIESLGSAGGFSGAEFYRISAGGRLFCLRRWPTPQPTAAQLRFIHNVLVNAREQGCDFLAAPFLTVNSATFVRYVGHHWELTPWMPGEANYHRQPSREKLTAAMTALATFHLATCHMPAESPALGSLPGIADRLQRLEQISRQLGEFAAAIDGSLGKAFAERSRQLLMLFPLAVDSVRQRLASAATLQVALSPCIRDIWHDHMLFTNDGVTGLIDFGAMRIDNVATDIARLVGSLVADEAQQWDIALDAYCHTRPLSDDERTLIIAYDQSSVLMSGLSWVDWIYCQRRKFEQTDAILVRLDTNIRRLMHLAKRLSS